MIYAMTGEPAMQGRRIIKSGYRRKDVDVRYPYKLLIRVLTTICVGVGYGHAADRYPSKPIRLITPFAPGGATDVLGRYLAQKLSLDFGQRIIIDSRPSGGGILACQITARSNPDGYTLLMGSNGTHAMNVSLYAKLPYDPLKDFEPVTRIVLMPNVLTVNSSVAAKSVQELVQLAKSKPGALKYASSGNGSPPHLMGELFKSMAQVDVTHVPYKGGTQSTFALLSGEVDINFNTLATSLPHIRSGKVRALGLTSLTRSEALPDAPTISEAGVLNYEVTTWYGIFVPALTPRAIVTRLSTALGEVLKSQETKELYSAMGGERVFDTPAEFLATIKKDITKWRDVVQAAGARVE
jgi:tripartite-type tricarboxylate transporter receptor subunit TctC